MQILALMMVMMMMTLSYSALADQSLTCHNDYYNTFTCVWDTSKLDVIPPVQPETICWVHVAVEKLSTTVKTAQMFADPAQPHIRSATVVFDSKRGIIASNTNLHEEVRCDSYTNPVAETAKHTAEDSAVKVAPPQKVEVHGFNVSWSFVSSRTFLKPEFEVQFRSAAQSWKDVEDLIVNTKETQLELPEEHLLLKQQYVIRVRIKYQESKLPNAQWSDWSEEYSWTSAVGQTPPTPGLTCHNDYYNTFTCVWDTSKLDVIPPVQPETICWVHVAVEKLSTTVKTAQMFADPAQPHIRSATVVFDSKRGIITAYTKLHEEVQCDNYTNHVAETAKHTAEDSAVKVAPPQKVQVHGFNVSWSFVPSRTFLKPEFGVQFRSAAQNWKDVEDLIVNTKETQLELPEERLLLDQQYVIRVRVKYQESKLPNAQWSDWSEEYSWTSAVGQTPPTPEILQPETTVTGITLTGITLTTILIFTILVKCKRIKRVQKNGSTYIPDPSKFFGDLNSSHGGNFTSWLGSVLAHESFIRVDTEFISPVEVLKLQDTCESRSSHRNSGGPQDGWDSTAKSSNFSNSTYFMSQSSKGPSDALEPCSVHSSYGPAGGVGDVARSAGEKEELEFCLEKLRQDTQSPDSGFAGGAEDSMEETELPSPLGLNLAPLLPQNLPAPQPSRHLLMGLQCTDLLLRPSCPIPALDLDLLNLGLQSSCGLIEPSSGDYMPVKNVQS